MRVILPELVSSPRDWPCRASLEWDPEAAVFSAAFVHAEPPPPANLQRRLDEALGIRVPLARLLLGAVDIAMLERRLDSLVVRTSPAEWARRPLRAPDAAAPVWFEPVCAFDANRIASVAAATAYARDGDLFEVCFAGVRPVRWVALADRVFAGLCAETRLCGLLFAGCPATMRA